MATHISLMLTIRNGLFTTVATDLLGAKKLETALKSVLGLIQNDTPLLTKDVMTDLLRRATSTKTRNTKKAEVKIGGEIHPVTAGTIDALTNLIGAAAIAGLAADDKRRNHLKNINRALARQDLCLDVEIDHVQLPRIDRLAMAPHAHVDLAWTGEEILKVRSWHPEILLVGGRGENHRRIKLDMHRDPANFKTIMQDGTSFLRVNLGQGRVNKAGLRILQYESLDALKHNDLPAELQLHFADD